LENSHGQQTDFGADHVAAFRVENRFMIPSTPRRTGLFLGVSFLLYFAPDLLTPEIWQHHEIYPMLSACYQGALVLLGFGYGPAICRAMVEHEISAGPTYSGVHQALTLLSASGRRLPPVMLAEQITPFVLTAGLWPTHCQTFISSALAERLSATGLRFLLARAAVHATLRHRLVSVLPILAITVLVPDSPTNLAAWLGVAGILSLWLLLHWTFELDADRQAARMLDADASEGLREVEAATRSPLGWLTPQPPMPWRLRAIRKQAARDC
jgi:hypothetical protein